MRQGLLLLTSCSVSFCLGGLFSLGLFPGGWQRRSSLAGRVGPVVEDDSESEAPGGLLPPPTPTGRVAGPIRQKDPLWSRVRIFCWILTSPENHARKAYHVKATWVPRCNGYAFMSSRSDPLLPTVALDVPEGRSNLWLKTVAALRYLRNHSADLISRYDFFLKADDDTYVVMDNLRALLAGADPDSPLYAGRRFRQFVRQGYMSGGAGYALSRAALRKVVDFGLPSRDPACAGRYDSEDVNLGACLEMLGVRVLDSLDSLGRERFHPFRPENHLAPGGIPPDNWLSRYNYYPLRLGSDCCSDTSVSFHYVTPRQMYALDYLIYYLRRPISTDRRGCSAGQSMSFNVRNGTDGSDKANRTV